MNISNFPTSNFYVFCTILGLLLICAGGTHFRAAEVAHREAYLVEKRNFVEIEHLTKKLKSEIETLLSRHGDEFFEQGKIVEQRLKSLGVLLKNHIVAAENISFLYEDYRRASFLMYGSFLFGLLMSIFGLFFWYRRTQRYLDFQQESQIEVNKALQRTSR